MQYIFLGAQDRRHTGGLWFEIPQDFQSLMRDYLLSKVREIEDMESRKAARYLLSKAYLKSCAKDYSADIFAYCKVGGKQHFRFYTNCGQWRVGYTEDQAVSLMERVKFEIMADIVVYRERQQAAAAAPKVLLEEA